MGIPSVDGYRTTRNSYKEGYTITQKTAITRFYNWIDECSIV